MRNHSPRLLWGIAILGIALGSVQVGGNLVRAAAEEDWVRFDRLLSWLWITIGVVIGLTVLVLLAMNLVMVPFWRLRATLRQRFPDRPVHLSYESTDSSGNARNVPPDAIGQFSVVLTATRAGLQLWRGREPYVVLEIPVEHICGVDFVCTRWRRPMMRVALTEPATILLFSMTDDVALGIGGSSPTKVKQIVEEIAAVLNKPHPRV